MAVSKIEKYLTDESSLNHEKPCAEDNLEYENEEWFRKVLKKSEKLYSSSWNVGVSGCATLIISLREGECIAFDDL